MNKIFKKDTLHSQYALKKGSIATAITAVFIVCVILLNVLVTALAQKYPISFDITNDKQNSISAENIKYLKDVKKDVYIYVLGSEDDFTGGYFSQYANYYYNASDPSGKYYVQTVALIKSYSKYNKKLHVSFVGADSAESTELKTKFSSYEFGLGDILLECSVNGNTRQKVITFADIYELYDDSGYASYGYTPYTVSGSRLESALTSAIYYVTSEKTLTVGIPADYCDESEISGLLASLQNYDYTITDITGPVLENIDTSIDALILFDMKADLTATDIAALEKFLENDGHYGKSIMYFDSVSSPALPNLYAFLEKWGIRYSDGILYETDTGNYLSDDPSIFGSLNTRSEYSEGVNDSAYYYISTDNKPMELLTDTDKTLYTLLQTTDTVYCKLKDGGETEKKSFPVAVASKQTSGDLNSNVIAFSSVDFLTTPYNNSALVGNIAFVAEVLNHSCGREATTVELSVKTIDVTDFSASVTAGKILTMNLLFMLILPLSMVALGIVVYIKRKNK